MVFEYFSRNLLHRKQCIASHSAGPPRLSILPLCLGAAPACCSCTRDTRKCGEMRDLAHMSTGNCTNLTLAGVTQDLFLVWSRLGSRLLHVTLLQRIEIGCVYLCASNHFLLAFFSFWLTFMQVKYYVCLWVTARCPDIHEVMFSTCCFFLIDNRADSFWLKDGSDAAQIYINSCKSKRQAIK